MAVRTTQEIIDALKESFGESPDDTQLAMLEDVSDTFSDLNEKCSEDWKTKYEETYAQLETTNKKINDTLNSAKIK